MATPLQQMTAAGTRLQKFVPLEIKRVTLRRNNIQKLLPQARKLGLNDLTQKLQSMRGHCATILDALSDEKTMLDEIDFATAKPGALTQFVTDLEALESRIDTFVGMYRGMLPKAKALLKPQADKFDAKLATWFLKDAFRIAALDSLVNKLTAAVNAANK